MTEGVKAKFVAAWSACQNPEIDSENPHFRNRYASLKATLATVREACGAHGLAYVQRLGYAMTEEGYSFDRYELSSFVTDGEGTMDLSRFPVECPPNPQSFGSNLTYAKRQQAQADWGITGEPDDDGEAAADHADKKAGGGARKTADRRTRMLARCAELGAKCIENGMRPGATEEYMTAKYGVASVDELDDGQLEEFGMYLAEMEKQSAEARKEQR